MPSNTPEPTFTPLPTETPSPVPTSTPDKTATAGAQATETSDSILNVLNQLLGDTDIPYKEEHLAWKQGKPLLVSLSGPSGDYVEIDDDLIAGKFYFEI